MKKPPTVFKDCRGEIRKIKFHGVEVNLVFTKAGALRSGDMHPNRQYDHVLKGQVALGPVPEGQFPIEAFYFPGDLASIPAKTPHLFKSITSSVVLEWWDGPFKATYYRPYRKLVEKWIKEHGGK